MQNPTQRLVTGLVAACLAQAVQTPFFWRVEQPLPPAFFLSQFLVIAAVQVALALLLGGRGQDRGWAAAAFLLPAGLVLAPFGYAMVGGGTLGAAVAGVLTLGLLAAWGLWARFSPVPGAPVAAAVLGALFGAELLRFLTESFRGSHTPLPALAALGLAGALTLGAALFAGRLRALPLPAAAALGAAGLAGAALWAPLDTSWATPPASVAESDSSLPPVVLVVLDTVRADHLKSYGHSRDTMPNLERFWRDQAVRVDQAISNAAWTYSTHASIFTGLHPPRHGGHLPFIDDPAPPRTWYALKPELPTLAELMTDAGYWTVGISGNTGSLAPALGLGRGFELYRAVPDPTFVLKPRTPWRVAARGTHPLRALDRLPPFSRSNFFGPTEKTRRAREITDDALAIVDAAADRPFFLFLNYFDAHTPYTPPAPFDPGVGPPPSERLSGSWHPIKQQVMSGDQPLDAEEQAWLRALYDGELSYIDRHLGRLFARLMEHPRWEEMLVIVTSDHGEAFGEHEQIEHPGDLYREMIRVPLFMKPGTGVTDLPEPGATLERIFESVDLFATVLEHGSVAPPAGIDGLAWGRGRTHGQAWFYLSQVFSDARPERFRRELRTIEGRDWKLLAASSGTRELYDLRSDPAETTNRAGDAPDALAQLETALGGSGAESRTITPEPADLPEDILKHLKALGYIAH